MDTSTDDPDNFLTRQKLDFEAANDTDLPTLVEEDENTKSHHLSDCKELEETKVDGIVLKNSDDHENQISPIPMQVRTASKRRIGEEDMDNISICSTTASLSLKKPKLMRTGSLTKNLRKSLSFGIMKTPTLFKSRRYSTDHDVSASASMISMESTFNETFTKPMKEKFRRIKEKVAKISGKSTPTKRMQVVPVDYANLNSTLPACMKTPEKGQFAFASTSFLEPKTPKNQPQMDFQMPKSCGKLAAFEPYEHEKGGNNMVILIAN